MTHGISYSTKLTSRTQLIHDIVDAARAVPLYYGLENAHSRRDMEQAVARLTKAIENLDSYDKRMQVQIREENSRKNEINGQSGAML